MTLDGFKLMAPFYAAMAGIPLLLWIIAVTSPIQQLYLLRAILAIVVGVGSIIFGVIGYKEVFQHGG